MVCHPRRERHHRRVDPQFRHVKHGRQTILGHGGEVRIICPAQRHDPCVHASTVQFHTHDRPRPNARFERGRDEVVELLVDPGDVGNDARDE